MAHHQPPSVHLNLYRYARPAQAQARGSRYLRTQDQQTHRHSCNGLVLHCSSPDHRRPRLNSAACMATLVATGNAKHCPRPVPLAFSVCDGKTDYEIYRTIEETNRPLAELNSMISASDAHFKALRPQANNIFRGMILGKPRVFIRLVS